MLLLAQFRSKLPPHRAVPGRVVGGWWVEEGGIEEVLSVLVVVVVSSFFGGCSEHFIKVSRTDKGLNSVS